MNALTLYMSFATSILTSGLHFHFYDQKQGEKKKIVCKCLRSCGFEEWICLQKFEAFAEG
jgi:hypothetical protein